MARILTAGWYRQASGKHVRFRAFGENAACHPDMSGLRPETIIPRAEGADTAHNYYFGNIALGDAASARNGERKKRSEQRKLRSWCFEQDGGPYRNQIRPLRTNIHVVDLYRSDRHLLEQSMSPEPSLTWCPNNRQQANQCLSTHTKIKIGIIIIY